MSFAALLFAGCGTGPNVTSPVAHLAMQGSVHGGQQPVTGALLQLYAVGTSGDGSAATPLITATLTTSDGTGANNSNANAGNALNTLSSGAFVLTGTYTCPSADTQVYLVATGGNPGLSAGSNNPALAMMAVLGRCGDLTPTTDIQINELTTVGSIAPIAQYMNGYASLGSGAGDLTAFVAVLDKVRQYTNFTTGSLPGPQLPPDFYASQLEAQTLGDILAGCVNSAGGSPCTELFTLTTPPISQAVRPTDTIAAAINIVKYPNNNVQQIFNLLAPGAPFQPTLVTPPASWSLPVQPIAITPAITPAGGTLNTAPSVSITSGTGGATIYYTTNGSTPTTSSSIYNAPFKLTGTATVKAFAVASGFAASGVASTTYTLPNAGVAVALAYQFPPFTTVQTAGLNDISVQIVDAYGNAVNVSGVPITIRLGANPTAATLTGTVTAVTQRGGAASFSGLKISALGTGYTLIASSTAYGSVESAPFDQVNPYITITPSSALVGVGSILPGKVKLATAAPAGGVTVSLSSSDDTRVSIAPATVSVAAGFATADFTYTGVAAGSSTLRASAAGYTDGTSDVTATAAMIVLQQPTSLAPGATVQLPVTLNQPAPAGGVTVTIVSSNTAVATISGTAFFPEGSNKPSIYPTITGVSYGTTTLTASATGTFAPAMLTINLTNTVTLTSTLNVTQYGSSTDTITLGSPAPSGGLVFVLTADSTALVTIPTTVTVAAGATTATFTVSSKGTVGSTIIRANRTGLPEATTSVKVATALFQTTVITGTKLQSQGSVGFSGNVATPTTITLTSSAPGVLLLASDPNTAGTASISLTVPAGTSTVYYYAQGVAVGTASVTASSDTATASTITTMTVRQSTVTVAPSQLGVFTSNFSTTTTSADTTFGVHLALLNGSAVESCGGFAPGSSASCSTSPLAIITVPLTNSNDAVGTLSATSVTFANNSQTATATFHPLTAGNTTVAVGAPAGFPTPTSYSSMQATVVAPTFTVSIANAYLGNGVYLPQNAALSATPSKPVTVTVTSSNPNLILISGNATLMGSASVDLPNVTGTVPTVYLQGVGTGNATITYSSPGYTNVSFTVAVTPAGLVFNGSSNIFNTTTATPNGFVGVILAVFTDATASNVRFYCSTSNQTVCNLNPNVSPQFTINNSNAAAANLTPNPFTLPTTSITTITFQPVAAGSGTLTFATQPSPLVTTTYSTYGNQAFQVSQATLNANAVTTGTGVYVASSASLTVAPTSTNAKTMTITSSNPAVALLSTSAGTVGQTSISFSGITNTAGYTFYVQGQTAGTATITISAPGFTTGTNTITVLPTGVVFPSTTTATFNTTAFATARTLTVNLALLNSATGAIQTLCTTNCFANPGMAFSAGVTSSNTNTGTVSASPVTIAGGASSATTTFVPNDVGSTVISIAQPAGFTPATNAGFLSGTVTVTGDYFNPSPTVVSEGTYIAKSLFLPSTPPTYPVTVTVSLADPSKAKLSTSEGVMGTDSSLTLTLTSGGQLPVIYIQGVASGRTLLLMRARGYATGRAPVTVYKTGVTFTLPNEAGIDLNLSSGNTSASASGIITYLDPTTLSFISYCGAGTCKVNPGQSTTTVFATDDSSVVAVTATTLSADSNSLYTVPLNPLASGVTMLRVATPPAGWYATTTPYHAAARLVVNDVTHLVAHDIDTAVGLQVQTGFTLSATNFTSLSATFTATIADTSIAVIGSSYTAAGGSSVSATGTGALGFTFAIQGLKEGTTTMTVSGGGYTPRVVQIRVNPGGFVFRSADVVRILSSGNMQVPITPAVLNSSGQWIADAYATNPGTGTGSPAVAATSSDTTIGTVVTSPVLVGQASAGGNVVFHPVAVGSTILSVGSPAGFSQATTYNTLSATVQ